MGVAPGCQRLSQSSSVGRRLREADGLLAQQRSALLLPRQRQRHRQPGAQTRPQTGFAVAQLDQGLLQQQDLGVVEQSDLEAGAGQAERGLGQFSRPTRSRRS